MATSNIRPAKILAVQIGNFSVSESVATGPYTGSAFRWTTTLTITPQQHSSPEYGTSALYNGTHVAVNDWIVSSGSGAALKIVTITSQTATSVLCVVEDVNLANTAQDNSGSRTGLIPTGNGYLFELAEDGFPAIYPLPDAIAGTIPANFVTQLFGRFMFKRPLDGTGLLNFTGDATGSGTRSIPLTLANVGAAGTYYKVTVDAKGRVTAGASLVAADIPNLDWAKITTGKPTTLAGYGITNAVTANTAITAGTYAKITFDTKGLITAGAALAATDIPNLDWGKITSGKPTTLAGYGITDAVAANALITAGTAAKITYDAKGLVVSGTALVATDIPSLPWSKITSGKPTTLAGYGITDAQEAANYEFTVNFDAGGSPSTITNLPTGWSGAVAGNEVTITHTVGNPPDVICYFGKNTVGGVVKWRARYPTAANEMYYNDTDQATKFVFTINSSVAAADLSGLARVVVRF